MSDSCSSSNQESLSSANDNRADGGAINCKKTVLFAPLNGIGHVNCLIGIANFLKHLGHRTVFLFSSHMDAGLKANGHEVYDCEEEGLVESKPSEASARAWCEFIDKLAKSQRSADRGKQLEAFSQGTIQMMNMVKDTDAMVERKLQLIKPDVIIIDHFFMQPALMKYGKPWAKVYSASPLSLYPSECKLPLAFCGFPSNWEHDEEAMKWSERIRGMNRKSYQEWNEYLAKEHGFEPTPLDPMSYIYQSAHLNVYMYPQELDYNHVTPPKGWIRCDSLLRINSRLDSPPIEKFAIPEVLRDKVGKLIFLSMGSLASADVELMKRLIGILAKSPHRFIVSMGLNADKYELASNMWGEKYVEQLAILPAIDLIITHGGNNTITECFYFGVPGLVVCPVFADQLDNAQRIEECKLGRRLNPFFCTEQQLLSAVEETLADATIRPRMKAISERMQKPENRYKALNLFRHFVESDHAR